MALSGRAVLCGRYYKYLNNCKTKQLALMKIYPQKGKATTATLTDTWIDRPDREHLKEENLTRPNVSFDLNDPAYQNIDLSFENAREAFKSKTNFELLRAIVVFRLCSFSYIVDNNKKLMKLSRRLFGKSLFEKVMKSTFYGQFVAGEDELRIRPVIDKNIQYGVKSILDYSVEKDLSREQAQAAEMESCVSHAQPPDHLKDAGPYVRFRAHREFGDRRESVTGARTYFYHDEAVCDDNMDNILNAIDAVSGATNATGFAAVKLTALGRPQLLLQLSEVLASVQRFYENISSKGVVSGRQKVFEKYLKTMKLGKEDRRKWFTILDVTKDGEINLLDWNNLLEVDVSLAKLLRVPDIQTGSFVPLVTSLTDEEEDQMKNMLHRVDTVVKYGKEKDVRVMIDAEQTYFQTAINRLCMEMMRTYNKEKAIVFNTYQCYLKDAFNMIRTDLDLSKREGFYFGAKLVRGAYMDQERKRAETLNYEDPINPSFDATTAMVEKVLTEVMQEIQERERGKIAVMVASHNEDSIRFTVKQMKENGIKASDRLICFGQLLGMCDQVSFSLGQAGYSVYKYLPYGPVEEVMPYLSRRATENRSLLGEVKKERQLLSSELWRRLKNRDWFYQPPPVQPTSPV